MTKLNWKKKKIGDQDKRLEFFRYAVVLFASIIILKLGYIQIFQHGFYEALASGQHEFFQKLIPKRGMIYLHDLKDQSLVPLAVNQQLASVYADPRQIKDPRHTSEALGTLFGYTQEQVEALEKRLNQPEDPYEPIAKEVDDKMLEKISALKLEGVHSIPESVRLYPEPEMSGHLLGFLGTNEDGSVSGKYGIEGYFDKELSGTQGYLLSERDIAGRLIAVAEREYEPSQDGVDIVLTLDRTIQYKACSVLQKAVLKHGAEGGSVVIVEPFSGKILAMCGAPDYNPNAYNEVDSIRIFNNPVLFNAYEPGSIFKPLTMAAAVDVGAVTPKTTYIDTGSVMVEGWYKPIGNAEGKVYGESDMTKVLEESINTGMIFSMRAMGQETFVDYVKAFGFGKTTGIEIETEVPGTIDALDFDSEIYAATASFGQGITVTPLQIVMAYAAIANGGVLKQPIIVDEIRHPDGLVEKRATKDIVQVIDPKSARTVAAMLVSVIEHGHGKKAAVPGYYIAGKTGTAQVARKDGIGYDQDNTIGSFAGFGPVENPRFAMVVRIDNPQGVVWAESTAAPLFGELAEFLLQYFEVPPVREVIE
ncbi:MAG: Peptidoglycan glycosyltransferase [Candidatus Uhrbacteria bacterium GW2011_GWF2_39_13]|uniref:Peptidoglycan glycosyltransferase n=1 Tax=Candidatus Uhrbacteria bacterium GW2011_GWF2_39_13 TaxID=1618995 RepID=A0A0G0MWV9_9BACT|nr:MAG: Peptidoglycan glycosyltransferase [Candidatus Uhrbacteria bacterium GW2011_GWF2_39_13]HAU66136.1 penicillin-binding protein 2 [Candidatus Uhrbacteria bacterium]